MLITSWRRLMSFCQMSTVEEIPRSVWDGNPQNAKEEEEPDEFEYRIHWLSSFRSHSFKVASIRWTMLKNDPMGRLIKK